MSWSLSPTDFNAITNKETMHILSPNDQKRSEVDVGDLIELVCRDTGDYITVEINQIIEGGSIGELLQMIMVPSDQWCMLSNTGPASRAALFFIKII